MASNKATGESAERTAGQFATTHWSVVLAAADSAAPGAQDALEKLCRTYWLPLYAFIRRNRRDPEDARDLTQAFFEKLLRNKGILHELAPAKGRFRNYLLTVLKRFLRDERDRATAVKRGGGVPLVPLDAVEGEAHLQDPQASDLSPDQAYDRAWAETVLHGGVKRLREEYEGEGNGALFAELSPYLSRPTEGPGYGAIAARLNLDEGAVASAVYRLRRRYRERVRAEVAHTVATPAETDEELHYLIGLLSR